MSSSPTLQYVKTRPFLIARLPIPPGINQSYQIIRGSRRLALTEQASQFKKDAALMLTQATLLDQNVLVALHTSRKTPLAVSIKFYFETLWRRDVDGGIKQILDVLFSYLGLNDTLVVQLEAEKFASNDPHVDVEVCCLATQE